MARSVKGRLQMLLKVVNSVMGAVGIVMIMYSIRMVRAWQIDVEESSSSPEKYPLPWFVHVVLGAGITLCAITCLGHVAADIGRPCCLSSYIAVVFVLLLAETALYADILLNAQWEKDLPRDPKGVFDDFKDFVKSNFDTCRWIALLVVFLQGCLILLATLINTTGTDQGMDYSSGGDHSDGDNYDQEQPTLPLLSRPEPPLPYSVGDSPSAFKNESRSVDASPT